MYRKARLHLENYIKYGKDELRKSQALKIIDKLTKLLLEDENFKTAYNLISTGLENKGIEEITSFIEGFFQKWSVPYRNSPASALLISYES